MSTRSSGEARWPVGMIVAALLGGAAIVIASVVVIRPNERAMRLAQIDQLGFVPIIGFDQALPPEPDDQSPLMPVRLGCLNISLPTPITGLTDPTPGNGPTGPSTASGAWGTVTVRTIDGGDSTWADLKALFTWKLPPPHERRNADTGALDQALATAEARAAILPPGLDYVAVLGARCVGVGDGIVVVYTRSSDGDRVSLIVLKYASADRPPLRRFVESIQLNDGPACENTLKEDLSVLRTRLGILPP